MNPKINKEQNRINNKPSFCEAPKEGKYIMSTSECFICSNVNENKLHTVPEMMYGNGDTFDYVECGSCGCLQIAQIPKNIEKYYPANYYSYSSRLDVRTSLKIWLQSVIIKNRLYGKYFFKSIASRYKGYSFIDFLTKNDYLTKNTKILDVGCGTGALLLKLNRIGFKHLSGVDPFLEKDIEYRNGIHIRKKYLHEIEEKHDIVMLHHSFEHMEDPLSTLNDIRKILAPGGIVLIGIPMASSFAWEHYGVNWVQLDAPRHLYLHTRKSMSIISEKAGLEIVDVQFDSTEFQFWGSEQYLLKIPLTSENSHSSRKSRLFTNQQIQEYKYKAEELNRQQKGDQAYFILRVDNKVCHD